MVPWLALMSASAKPTGTSLKLKLMVAVSPALTAATLLDSMTLGAWVSMVTLAVVAALVLPT